MARACLARRVYLLFFATGNRQAVRIASIVVLAHRFMCTKYTIIQYQPD